MADKIANGSFERGIIAYPEEICVGYSGVSGDGHDARVCSAQAPVEFEGEHHISEFRLLIGPHGRIGLRGLQVVKVEAASFVRDGGNCYYAWSFG